VPHPSLQVIRQRYGFACGYCGVSEADVGGELTVDHFQPRAAGGGDDEDNLVYACIRCNQYKGMLHADPGAAQDDRRLLHPLRDEFTAHLYEDLSTGLLEGLTERGRFQIEALRLNRPALIVNRQRRQLIALLQARLNQALAENAAIEERLARRELYISYLEQRLEALDREVA
jgi:hypothetical protein